jgi:hypothetical protein
MSGDRWYRIGWKQTEYRIAHVVAESEDAARDQVKMGLVSDSSFDMYDDDCEITFVEDEGPDEPDPNDPEE